MIVHSLRDAVDYVETHPNESEFKFSCPTDGLKTHGVPYFSGLVRKLTEQFPNHRFQFMVDAAEDVGLAMAAFEAGFTQVAVSLPENTYTKLSALAKNYGAKVIPSP